MEVQAEYRLPDRRGTEIWKSKAGDHVIPYAETIERCMALCGPVGHDPKCLNPNDIASGN